MKDPALEEIRRARYAISEAVDFDPFRLVEYYINMQERDLAEAKAHDASVGVCAEDMPQSHRDLNGAAGQVLHVDGGAITAY